MNIKHEEAMSFCWVSLCSVFFAIATIVGTTLELRTYFISVSSGVMLLFLTKLVGLPITKIVSYIWVRLRSKKNRKKDEVFLLLSLLSSLPENVSENKLEEMVLVKIEPIYPAASVNIMVNLLAVYAAIWCAATTVLLHFQFTPEGILTSVVSIMVVCAASTVTVVNIHVYLNLSTKWRAEPATLLAITQEQRQLGDIQHEYKNIRRMIKMCEHIVTQPKAVRIYELLASKSDKCTAMQIRSLQYVAKFLKEPTLHTEYSLQIDKSKYPDVTNLLNLFKQFPIAKIEIVKEEPKS